MKLNIEKIKEITFGTAYISKENNSVQFHRFTREQENAYFVRSADLYKKTFATAGVFMEFRTDSKKISLAGVAINGSSRNFYAFEVFADGALVKTFNENFEQRADRHEFAFAAELGEGIKTVKIIFPWSVKADISAIELDDDAFVALVKKEKTMLIFGDSITQGYDAAIPSNSYATKLTHALSANAVNKGIGGEFFWSELAGMKDDISPDYITVAYGTNDWRAQPKEAFEKNCLGFYENLRKNYPDSKIFAIAPIWRTNFADPEKAYPFSYTEEYLRKISDDIQGMYVINGFNFVPHDPELFSDRYVHPNDRGFEYYANALLEKLKEYGV